MEELLSKLPGMLQLVATLIGGVVLVATAVARFTKTPKDDEAVGKVREAVLRVLRYLPTLGVNPQTKSLEKALEDSKGK